MRLFRLKHRPLTDPPVIDVVGPRHLADAPTEPPTLTAEQLEIRARAEKRLAGMITRRGVDDEVLSVMATYEALFNQAGRDRAPSGDDTMALVRAVAS